MKIWLYLTRNCVNRLNKGAGRTVRLADGTVGDEPGENQETSHSGANQTLPLGSG
ncbi:hypothetical protein [Sporomusa termitida]|uniref:hypothetical protein n=1 Tax=Sporomusa termitida TaxID=2377 RepID=UPI001479790A|nr:hypothetical protein [Sporomusa termitida]